MMNDNSRKFNIRELQKDDRLVSRGKLLGIVKQSMRNTTRPYECPIMQYRYEVDPFTLAVEQLERHTSFVFDRIWLEEEWNKHLNVFEFSVVRNGFQLWPSLKP